MGGDVPIAVQHVSKDFLLPHEKVTSVKGLFTAGFRRHGRTKERQHALRDVSFEIKPGEFFGIVGRNGSGKSTLLKLLAGIYQPTAGHIRTQGTLVSFIELGVGFNGELSGRENVYLNGAMMGFSISQIDAMYDEIVRFAELERFMDQKLKNYSSGMQVRLAFSVAIQASADILLIDEVLAVGDADFQRKCFNYFRSLRKRSKTVVFVSHDMKAITEFCDRALLIDDSIVQYIGKPSEAANRYAQLFMTGAQPDFPAVGNGSTARRSGNGFVTVRTMQLAKQLLTDRDASVNVEVTLDVHQRHQNLMTGLRVKDASGQTINETNTWLQNLAMPRLAPGEQCAVTWELPNVYADGQYTIDIYVYGKDAVVFDAMDEALLFQVKRPDARGVVVTIPAKVTTTKLALESRASTRKHHG